MTFRNGHDGPKDPNVASLDDARRRAADRKKADARASTGRGPRTTRDWIIGGVIVAMAFALIASWVMSIAPATLPGGGGGL